MIFNYRNNLDTGASPFGAISMNFGGGGEGTPPSNGTSASIGGTGINDETGITITIKIVGISGTAGISMNVT